MLLKVWSPHWLETLILLSHPRPTKAETPGGGRTPYCVLTSLSGGSDMHQTLRTTAFNRIRGIPTHTPSSLWITEFTVRFQGRTSDGYFSLTAVF